MHDVIRDMCLWIACTCEAEKWKVFVQAGYQLTKVPEVAKWRGIRRMSLMDNKIENLKEAPNCPDLQTLFLSGNKPLEVIDNDFFQFMCVLKVLDLSGNRGSTEFPMGISKLVFLEYLDLSRIDIRELPIELKALKMLKCLNLEETCNRIKIPRGLMSGFSKLQLLRMYDSYPFDEAVEDDNECLAEELVCLNQLNVLTLSITSAFALDRFLSAERLHSFIETIGLEYFKDSKQLNILSLANFKSLNTLSLKECESLEEVKTVWEGEGRIIKAAIEIQTSVIASELCFQNIWDVEIWECSKLRDITWLILAPNLKYLVVWNCDKMEELINEIKLRRMAELVKSLNPFSNLQNLVLFHLPELKSIYLDALPFSRMKSIQVNGCPKLRRLPLNSNSAKGNKISIYDDQKWWKELQWEDESTQNAFLPSFIAHTYRHE